MASGHNQCPRCGQWADNSHRCPPAIPTVRSTSVAAAVEATQRAAIISRARHFIAATPPPNPLQEVRVEGMRGIVEDEYEDIETTVNLAYQVAPESGGWVITGQEYWDVPGSSHLPWHEVPDPVERRYAAMTVHRGQVWAREQYDSGATGSWTCVTDPDTTGPPPPDTTGVYPTAHAAYEQLQRIASAPRPNLVPKTSSHGNASHPTVPPATGST